LCNWMVTTVLQLRPRHARGDSFAQLLAWLPCDNGWNPCAGSYFTPYWVGPMHLMDEADLRIAEVAQQGRRVCCQPGLIAAKPQVGIPHSR
jgi:hypothetical protein